MSLYFFTCTFWNYYVLKLLRLEIITFSDATLSDINIVLCYVLSQYLNRNGQGRAGMGSLHSYLDAPKACAFLVHISLPPLPWWLSKRCYWSLHNFASLGSLEIFLTEVKEAVSKSGLLSCTSAEWGVCRWGVTDRAGMVMKWSWERGARESIRWKSYMCWGWGLGSKRYTMISIRGDRKSMFTTWWCRDILCTGGVSYTLFISLLISKFLCRKGCMGRRVGERVCKIRLRYILNIL